MIELPFNGLFGCQILESKSIVVIKLIKLCPDYIKKIEIDKKEIENDQKSQSVILLYTIAIFAVVIGRVRQLTSKL